MGDTDILPVRVQNVLDMEIVRLNLWSIKFTATNIKLEGFVRNDEGTMMQKVCSEVICKRMNATMLFDVSGRFFELAGQIDREFQIKHGMPSRIVDEFINGFPENWAFLISNCLTTEQRSAIRPIQAAPVQPLRPKEPIVTLADETELAGDRTVVRKETEKDRRNREREEEKRKKLLEEKRQREEEIQREKDREEEKRRQEEEAERKRKEEEEANNTFRAPKSFGTDAITPIRFTRGNAKKGLGAIKIFDNTPTPKRINGGPLASSTPQRPPPVKEKTPQPEKPPQKQQEAPKPAEISKQTFANDADLFAVPRLPTKSTASSGFSSGFDMLDEMDTLFETAKIDKTPVVESRRKPIPRRFEYESSPPPFRGQSSSSQAYQRDLDSRSYFNERYDDDRSRMSRRDGTFSRYDSGRDESRMSRKRGLYSSPDQRHDYDYSRRREDESRDRDRSRYDYRYDPKRSRARETSSSSGRSVRFEDDYRSKKHREDRRDREDRREYDRTRDQRERDMYEDRKLKEIMRRERELEAKLQAQRKSARRVSSSSDDSADETVNMADEWDRENQEMLDNSMMMDTKTTRKRKNVPKKEFVKPKSVAKPARASAKKNMREPLETVDLNESIASNRPRRSCVTAVPKRITWPKRDLDKLRHVIDLKKPSANIDDWVEVTRLLKKDGVQAAYVKLIAETKLKWKEPSQDADVLRLEEQEETKRRRGAAAKVKEGVRMRQEIRGGGEKEDDLRRGVEAVEDYQPDDMDADQSLLALATPVAAKKKGGTRASILPQPVEDSPLVRGNNTSSFMNSPKLDSTKVKEVETTLKYVQHLSTMQARPGSSMNKSSLNRSSSRGKNTSISVEQGTRKAMKIINKGTTIHEDDEEEEDEDDENSGDEEENSIY